MPDKSFTIYPEKTHFFWWFLAGILLIPLFGLGIYLIYKKNIELGSVSYMITDQQITYSDQKITDAVDLADIQNIDIEQRWIDKKFGIGTLIIRTKSKPLRMHGIKDPENLSGMILSASEAERMRLSELSMLKQQKPEVSPGTIDRLDYLTGLWQQGLISDEDFKKERKHFEN